MENNLIEEAFLCAPMCKAWFTREGKSYILFLNEDDDEDDDEEVHIIPARAGDIGLLWDGCLEISEVTEQIKKYGKYQKQLKVLKQVLKEQCHNHDALTFTLDGLDPELTDKTRASGIELAEELCQQNEVYSFVRQRLLNRPLAKGMDINKAIELSNDNNYSRMAQLYQNVQALDKAWCAIVPTLEKDPQRQEEWLKALTESKILADWVIAVLDGKPNEKEFCMRNQEVMLQFPQTRQLLKLLEQHLMIVEEQKEKVEQEVFIDAPVEEQEEVERLTKSLNKKGIEPTPPVNTSSGIRQFFNELEQNLLNCDTVFIPVIKAPDRWLQEHLRYYTKVQTKREKPLSVVIYNPTHRNKTAMQIPNLLILVCVTWEECLKCLMEEKFR